jgi:hypothetical protein
MKVLEEVRAKQGFFYTASQMSNRSTGSGLAKISYRPGVPIHTFSFA